MSESHRRHHGRPPSRGPRGGDIHVGMPTADAPFIATHLGAAMVGAWVHWIAPTMAPPSGRTQPCRVPEKLCEGCLLVNRPRWYGWIPCYVPETRRLWLACVPFGAAAGAADQLAEPPARWRGHILTLHRHGGSDNGRVTLAFGPRPAPQVALPGSFDVFAVLLRLWGVTDTEEGRNSVRWSTGPVDPLWGGDV